MCTRPCGGARGIPSGTRSFAISTDAELRGGLAAGVKLTCHHPPSRDGAELPAASPWCALVRPCVTWCARRRHRASSYWLLIGRRCAPWSTRPMGHHPRTLGGCHAGTRAPRPIRTNLRRCGRMHGAPVPRRHLHPRATLRWRGKPCIHRSHAVGRIFRRPWGREYHGISYRRESSFEFRSLRVRCVSSAGVVQA